MTHSLGKAAIAATAGIVVAMATLLAATPAWAQSCPANSRELGRRQEGNRLILSCACNEGYVTHAKGCHTIDAAANEFYVSQDDLVRILNPGFIDAAPLSSAATSGWSVKSAAAGLLSAIGMESGQVTPLDVMIRMIGPDADSHPAVLAARKKIDERRRGQEQLFMLLRPEIRRPMWELAVSHMPNKGKTAFVFGVTSFRLGKYDDALRLLMEAQRSVPGDRSLDEALVIVRMSQRSEWEKRQPEAARIGYARAFRGAGAHASLILGFQLVSSGDYAGGEMALRESIQQTQRLGLRAKDIDLTRQLADRARDDRAAGNRAMIDPPGKRPFDRMTKADLMLTACEYGQKDWARSLRFLEVAMLADRANPVLAEAYRDLKEIATSAQ